MDLSSSVGPLEIGLNISVFLFGLGTLQTFTYFTRGREQKDSPLLQFLIACLWLIELGQTVCFSRALYILTTRNFSASLALIPMPSTLYLSFFFGGLLGPLVQALYAVRIKKIAQNYYMCGLCWILAMLHVMGTVAITVIAMKSSSLVQIESHASWLFEAVLAADLVNDTIITIYLCLYLHSGRKSALNRTSKLINVLMAWTIETGLLTSLTTIAQLVLFLVMKQNLAWMIFFTCVPKFYSNNYLSWLNGRERLRSVGFDKYPIGTITNVDFRVEHSPTDSDIAHSDQLEIAMADRRKPPGMDTNIELGTDGQDAKYGIAV